MVYPVRQCAVKNYHVFPYTTPLAVVCRFLPAFTWQPSLQHKSTQFIVLKVSISARKFGKSNKFQHRDFKHSESIFSSEESAWDHVFQGIKEMPPLLPPGENSLRTAPLSELKPSRSRRQTMTAREISAFDDMFNMIFNAVSEQKKTASHSASNEGDYSEVGIGRGPRSKQMGDLFGKLRRHSKKMKWTSESDELLDRKKEEMDMCDTDQQLLEWAMREVFGESETYEEAARKAATETGAPGKEADSSRMLQPETYPHLVALLMRSFRDKYHDPHLALSIFEHARHLSIPSYVFGCSTQAYNELIETRWVCFRDLKGVCDALEEMMVNGVEQDSRTRRLVELLRREVGERNLWEEESEIGSGEVWEMLTRIECLTIKEQPRGSTRDLQSFENRSSQKRWDSWKNEIGAQADDGWEFGQWDDKRKPSVGTRRQRESSQFH